MQQHADIKNNSEKRLRTDLRSSIVMLFIATVILGHLFFKVVFNPNAHASSLLIEFIPFITCSVMGISLLSND